MPTGVLLAGVAALTALLSGVLIVLLRPLLVRYALARPNARSSHKVPTPQGGGIAVLAATLAGIAVAYPFLAPLPVLELSVVVAAAVMLACIGALDDIRPLPVLPRLVFQIASVGAVVVVAGGETQLLPALPLVLERTIEVVAGIWFVNLVNFMDGLDWMTVAEMVPVTAALALFALATGLAGQIGLVAAALLGALLGFAPFNRPVARLFLGDVGSLPIGLLVAWLLYELALSGAVAAALLLPLYYAADATVTLVRRLRRGEKVWEAHRSHYYQQATDNGFTVMAVVAHVFVLNALLAVLAAATLVWVHPAVQGSALGLGLVAVVFVLRRFGRTARAQQLRPSR